jgi:prepilin-type N-terminal cleavage/methylation domain-containing protein
MTLIECLLAAGARRGRPRRAGFTLIECLFAAAILAIGIIGIFSLIPMSIHQVSTSLGSTVGATAAKNALTSLQHRQLDLCDYAAPDSPAIGFATSFGDGSTQLNVAGGTALWTYPDLPAAICDYHRNTSPVGCGISALTFKIPGIGTEQYFTPGTWAALGISVPAGSNNPDCIPVPWARDFGWTAVFVPISDNDDRDGQLDEDTYGDSDGNGDPDDDNDGLVDEDDLIMPGTCYRVQVAVWRAYRLLYNGTLNGTFANNSNVVALSLTAPNARQGDYIRLDRYGVWHKIAAIQGTTVTLQTPFNHPSPGAAPPGGFTGQVSIASNFKLLGLYETVITPRSLRDTP